MCLNPIHLINPTRRISLYSPQQVYLDVKCGKCAECVKAMRSEWHFRAYYHTKATLLNGGYAMMDCLTYRPSDVPKLSHYIDVKKYGLRDYMVFDYKHVRDFIKNLRIRLKRLGYKSKNVFTYFITSEYGTSELRTHRPHYHLLLFVHDVRINPYKLSLIISDLWKYGRTDGLRYHPKLYVANHIYGYNSNDDISAILSVTNYVSKYVNKDSSYQNVIDNRLLKLQSVLPTDEFNTFKRNISMFHRQSQGFGLDYLNLITQHEYDIMLDTMEMTMPHKKYVHQRISLPMYYRRHLFYAQAKLISYNSLVQYDATKVVTRYWYLTDYGKHMRKKYLYNTIKKMADDIANNICINMNDDERYMFRRLLGSRSLIDYTTYMLLYRGRLNNGVNILPTDEMINYIVDTSNVYADDNILYRYNLPLAFEAHDIVTDKNLDYIYYREKEHIKKYGKADFYHHIRKGYEIHKLGDYMPIKIYIADNVYNENSFPCFAKFDKLALLLKSVNNRLKSNVQHTFDEIEKLKTRYKSMKGGV